MKNRSASPARAGVLAISCLMVASVAYGAPTAAVSYDGRTSQKQPISLTVAGDFVRRLRYRIVDRCPGGRRLRVKAWGFPPLAIKRSRFGGRFVAKPPHTATAIITGKLADGIVRGSLIDRSRNSKTHKLCVGTATFKLVRRWGSAGRFARSRRRYYDAGSERTALGAEKIPANFLDPGFRNSFDGNHVRVARPAQSHALQSPASRLNGS